MSGQVENRGRSLACPLPGQTDITPRVLYSFGPGMSATCPTCDRDGFKNNRGVKLHHVSVHEAVLIDWTECSWCSSPIIDDPRSPGGEYCSPECSQKASSENLSCEKVEVQCDRCGNKKEVYPYRAPSDNKLDSCKECWGKRIEKGCSNCSERIKVRPYRADDGEHFCSLTCENEWRSKRYKGENHPRWTGGYRDIPLGPNWVQKRRECIERDGGCYVCGMTSEESVEEYGRGLDVHHIVPRRVFHQSDELTMEQANQLENLMTMCIKHHRQAEQFQPIKEMNDE